MRRVYYKPGLGGDPICLEGDGAFVSYGGGLRSHKWTRSVLGRTVSGIAPAFQEVEFDVLAFDEQADALRRAADADAAAESPGTIQVDGEWNMRCYIVESITVDAFRDHVALRLKAALIDKFWWREKSRHFVTGLDASGLDFEYDHEYDLSFSVGSGKITVDSPQGALPRITFYGPCTNPYVIIGSNRYEVDVQVLSDHTCTIDATSTRPTVTLTDNQGNSQSVFSSAVRTGGIGGGSYAFQPFEHGDNAVQWSGSFAFDVTWHEMDTEPPWDR